MGGRRKAPISFIISSIMNIDKIFCDWMARWGTKRSGKWRCMIDMIDQIITDGSIISKIKVWKIKIFSLYHLANGFLPVKQLNIWREKLITSKSCNRDKVDIFWHPRWLDCLSDFQPFRQVRLCQLPPSKSPI